MAGETREQKRRRRLVLLEMGRQIFVQMEVTILLSLFCLKHLLLCSLRSGHAKRRVPLTRLNWVGFHDNISDQKFRRMFRMPKESFAKLCSKIEDTVGSSNFCSHEHITAYLNSHETKKGQMHIAASFNTGEYVEQMEIIRGLKETGAMLRDLDKELDGCEEKTESEHKVAKRKTIEALEKSLMKHARKHMEDL